MPSEFNTAWEYWQPNDPDISDILAESSELVGFSGLVDYRQDEGRERAITGFRFGNAKLGELSFFRFTLARRVVIQEGGIHYHIKCKGCSVRFLPTRHEQRYCSINCRPIPGAVRRRPLNANCVECGAEFEPMYMSQAHCSRKCAGKKGAPAKPPATKLETFAEMYLRGDKMTDIETAMGVKVCQLKRWRTQLGLPARAVGNHTQIERVGPKKGEFQDPERVERFRMMYLRGDPMEEIASELKTYRPQLLKWRKLLDLPPRPVGNHSGKRRSP